MSGALPLKIQICGAVYECLWMQIGGLGGGVLAPGCITSVIEVLFHLVICFIRRGVQSWSSHPIDHGNRWSLAYIGMWKFEHKRTMLKVLLPPLCRSGSFEQPPLGKLNAELANGRLAMTLGIPWCFCYRVAFIRLEPELAQLRCRLGWQIDPTVM